MLNHVNSGSKDTKVINLKHAIPNPNLEEEWITSLTLGRLKAKHLKLLPKEFFEGDEEGEKRLSPTVLVPLVAALANITEDQSGEIDLIDDLPVIGEALQDFLQKSLEIGKK